MGQRPVAAHGNGLREEQVAAYIIVEIETTDEALMTEYRKHTPGAVAKFGGKFIVRGGKTRTLEGGWTPPRVVVLEFPTYEKAEEFYHNTNVMKFVRKTILFNDQQVFKNGLEEYLEECSQLPADHPAQMPIENYKPEVQDL